MNKKNYFKDLNMAVITTVHILNSNSIIINVVHYNDGWWQFNGKESNLSDEEYKIVSLDEILTIDSTIKNLKNMECSLEANRRSKEDDWVISFFEETEE